MQAQEPINESSASVREELEAVAAADLIAWPTAAAGDGDAGRPLGRIITMGRVWFKTMKIL